jgi:beta-lactam-binding protein with PASTA domain
VRGRTIGKAKRRLRAAGCRVKVRKKDGRRVTKQKPRVGTEVPPGTPVRLTLGS